MSMELLAAAKGILLRVGQKPRPLSVEQAVNQHVIEALLGLPLTPVGTLVYRIHARAPNMFQFLDHQN